MSSTFFQGSLASVPRKRSRAPSLYQASAPSFSNASAMRLLTASSLRMVAEPSAFSFTNTAIGTPQARWREITQSGRLSIMPLMRFSPASGTQRVLPISRSAISRSVSADARDRHVHRDEPLRCVAEDHRLLGAPGVRILMLESAARDQHAGLGERLDHRLVGVALLAFIVDDAFASEARRLLGESAVFVDGVGDCWIYASLLQDHEQLQVQMSKSSRPWPGAVWTKPVPASSVTWSPDSNGTSESNVANDLHSAIALGQNIRMLPPK